MTSTTVGRRANSSPDTAPGPAGTSVTVEVRANDTVPAGDVAHAQAALEHALDGAPAPVGSARIDLTVDTAAIAKARAALGGRTVHAIATGATIGEAVDAVCARLRTQFAHFGEPPVRVQPTHGLRGVWCHGEIPGDRPEYTWRPADERRIVREKNYDPTPVTVEDAVRAASLLDVDFFLFTNASTGNDAVVRRVEGNTWALVEARRARAADSRAAADVAMRCTVEEATELLNVSNARFVFFIEPRAHCLHALYRRYDGDYALITPAATTA